MFTYVIIYFLYIDYRDVSRAICQCIIFKYTHNCSLSGTTAQSSKMQQSLTSTSEFCIKYY